MVDLPAPLERARGAMAAAGFDAVVAGSPGLVAFLTGHVVPAHLAFPSRDGRLEKPTLAIVTGDGCATVGVSPTPDTGIAIAYGADRAGLSDASFGAAATAAEELGLTRGRVAVELASVPAGALAALVESAPLLRIEPLDALLRDAKAVKSEAELAGVSAACELADAAHTAIRAAIQPGVSELDLHAEGVRAMNGLAGDLVLAGCELQTGVRGALMMGAPTGARVKSGDLVMADVYPRHPNGWWADSCSTTACGEPRADDLRTWHELHDGLLAGWEALQPGVRTGDVYTAIARHAGEQPGHAGHGIGRDHYEEPVIQPGNRQRLSEGMVIAIEAGRYGGGRGMRLEWAFRVNQDRAEPLLGFALGL